MRVEELTAQIHVARTLRHQAAEEADALFSRATSHASTMIADGKRRCSVKFLRQNRHGTCVCRRSKLLKRVAAACFALMPYQAIPRVLFMHGGT